MKIYLEDGTPLIDVLGEIRNRLDRLEGMMSGGQQEAAEMIQTSSGCCGADIVAAPFHRWKDAVDERLRDNEVKAALVIIAKGMDELETRILALEPRLG
jgi:hypothetical protein